MSNILILREKPDLWAGGMAEVVEHLPRKCEALSSNPCPTKKEKKKRPRKVGIPHVNTFYLSSGTAHRQRGPPEGYLGGGGHFAGSPGLTDGERMETGPGSSVSLHLLCASAQSQLPACSGIDAHLWCELSYLNLPEFQIVLLMPQMLCLLKHFNFEAIIRLLF
jgi:hypothetical protein